MTEAEIRAELQAILKEAQDRAELLGAVLELLDAERTQGDVHTRGGTDIYRNFQVWKFR